MSAYLAVLRAGRLGWLELATLVGRLPIGISGLALVLFLKEETGSFATGGAVSGGMALGIGLGAPLMGRWVDRRGTGVLMVLATIHASGILALVFLGKASAPTALMVVVAVVTGGAFPPSPSVLRARFPALLRDRPDLMQSAYALDSVLLELSFVTAPLVVAAVVAVLDPAAALVVGSAAAIGGTAMFLALLPAGAAIEPHEGERDWLGPLRSPAIRALVVTMLPVGFGIGAVEVSLPAFSEAEGHRELAGVLLATWSIGSAAGGFVYGVRPRGGSVARAHFLFALLLPLGFLPALLAPSIPLMAFLIVPAGIFIAPLIATRNELASSVAPPGTATEALTWPLTALVGGIAIGASVGGALADAEGWRMVLVAAFAAAAMGAAVAGSRRSTLAAATA
ncbi:MAG TPA: MFS transporter [Solirubrobacteraceae bacterium]|jgi:MFS family permease